MQTKRKSLTDFGFITFDREHIDAIVSQVGLKFNKNNYLVADDKTIHCDSCNHPITKKNLGNILPGSNVVCCDNPNCFTKYMNEHLNL